jgi:hypothetical protein
VACQAFTTQNFHPLHTAGFDRRFQVAVGLLKKSALNDQF